jgi:hypothetical protein
MAVIIAKEQYRASLANMLWQKGIVGKLEGCFEEYMKLSNPRFRPMDIATNLGKEVYELWNISNLAENIILDRWDRINKNEEMEKYMTLKCGMSISEVETVLNHELVLKELQSSFAQLKYYYYQNEYIGININFTDNKILDHIFFDPPFSLAVDGIKIGMSKNEVEKIKGKPEDGDPAEDYWFYYSKNIFYEFEENKVYSICLSTE